jgi:hypothetical protein
MSSGGANGAAVAVRANGGGVLESLNGVQRFFARYGAADGVVDIRPD